MHRSSANLSRGVTLVELMVAVTVLTVLTIVAVPSFTDFFDRGKLRGAADDVISLISNARAEGVKNDLDVNIAFTGSGASWCVGANGAAATSGGNPAGAADACVCTDTAQCQVAGQRLALDVGTHPGVTIGALPAAMVFDSNMGVLVPLGARQVTLTSPSGKYDMRVQINALGQAHACVPTGKPGMTGIAPC
jgi:type IV fimbrial biogenesis protein FimT